MIFFLFSLVWHVETNNIFSKKEFPLNYLNYLHVKTGKGFVKRIILSGKGEDSLSISETERRLRSLGIFREVRTIRVRDTVYLYLRDAFTLSAFVDYKFYNDKKHITLGIEEDNFLGTLSQIHLYYIKDYSRSYYQAGFRAYALPIKTTDLYLYLERGEHLYKNMVMLNPFITPLMNRYINLLYTRQNKYEYLYREGEVFDTSFVDFSLLSLKYGIGIKRGYTVVPYSTVEYLKTRDTVFRRAGAGLYYINLNTTIKTRYMRRSLYNDYLSKGLISRVEIYPLLWRDARFSLYLNAKTGNPAIYGDLSFIYSLSRGSGYARIKGKFYVHPLWRLTFFGLLDWGIIHDVSTSLSYENILVFSLGADNGLYAYVPHFFNGREKLLLYGEMRVFGPDVRKLVAPGIALFYGLGNAGETIHSLYRSFGVSFRFEAGVLGPSAIYSLNIGFRTLKDSPVISFGTTLDFL